MKPTLAPPQTIKIMLTYVDILGFVARFSEISRCLALPKWDAEKRCKPRQRSLPRTQVAVGQKALAARSMAKGNCRTGLPVVKMIQVDGRSPPSTFLVVDNARSHDMVKCMVCEILQPFRTRGNVNENT